MSIYKKISDIGSKYIQRHKLFKNGFNLSPMYRRTTARIISVSEDLLTVKIKLPITYKNRNYMNTIFGGSMFSAVDPIPMIQLVSVIGDDYVVWDKSAEIYFKKPAKEDLFAEFVYTEDEVAAVKTKVAELGEFEIEKTVKLTNQQGDILYCEVKKLIYIASKEFFKAKQAEKELSKKHD